MSAYQPAPSSMFGNIEQNGQNGMLGGYLQSIANEFALRQQQAGARDTDQDFLEKLRQYQMAQNNDQVTVADNANKLRAASDLGAQYDAGIPQAAARDEAATKIVTNQGKRDEVVRRQISDAGDFVDRAGGMLPKDRPLDMKNQADVDLWKGIVADGAKVGVRIDPAYTPEAGASLQRQREAWFNSRAYRQKIEEEKVRTTSAERIATGHDTTSTTNTRITADSRVDAAEARTQAAIRDPNRVILQDALKEAANGTVSEETLKQAQAALGPQFDKLWEGEKDKVINRRLQVLRASPEALAKGQKDTGLPSTASAEDVAEIQALRQKNSMARDYTINYLHSPKVRSGGGDTKAASNNSAPAPAETPPPAATGPTPKPLAAEDQKLVAPEDPTIKESVIARGMQDNRGRSRQWVIDTILANRKKQQAAASAVTPPLGN